MKSWDDIRNFLAIARAGSLSGAARELGVNVSTVFRRIQTFEEELGTRLFDRLPKAYALTASGEALLEAAVVVEDSIFAAERGVMGSDQSPSGRIRFTTADVFAFGLLGPHLDSFHQRYPDVELEVSVGPVPKSLSRREADVALRPGARPTEADVIARPLPQVAVAVYASPAYLEGRRRPRRLSDLKHHDLVTGDETVEHVRFMRAVREAAPSARITYRSDSVVSQRDAVQAGFGVAALPCLVADGEPSLERLIGPLDALAVDLWIVTHRDLRHSARIRAFVEHLTAGLSAERAVLLGIVHKGRAGSKRRRGLSPTDSG